MEILLVVLGTAQDGGTPQIGRDNDIGWTDETHRRFPVSLGLVLRDSASQSILHRWLFEATPSITHQLHQFNRLFPPDIDPSRSSSLIGLDGIFLTHAHIGHYAGLMFLGREAASTSSLPVFAMPRMAHFLTTNGPWSQLVSCSNILLQTLTNNQQFNLDHSRDLIQIKPFLVPHREEFSEVCGFRIQGPSKSVLFIPDIDSWEDWETLMSVRIEDEISTVDIAYLDGTFFSADELPGRDVSKIPHPFVSSSIDRFNSTLGPEHRQKVRFIHLNWSNPLRFADSPQRQLLNTLGFKIAEELEIFQL